MTAENSKPPTVRAGSGLLDQDVARLRDSVRGDPSEETFGGRFSLLAEAGSGGMGLVYEAVDRDTGKRVAIKVITGLPSPSDRARFTAEAEVLERLSHPAIVNYVCHGVTTRGEPYLAMEWLVGDSLTARLVRGPLSIAEAVILGERIADALDHAHRAGVVHRDLKPSNIFLVDGKPDQAHLIDFGVAKVFDHDLTQTGQMIGTPGYMAPEQVRGEKTVDHRADLFALGCVLYRSLTGRAAFEGAEVMEVLARLLLEHPQPLEECVPEIPPRLAHLVGSLLTKDPANRLGEARIAHTELRAIREAMVAMDTTSLQLRSPDVPAPRREPVSGPQPVSAPVAVPVSAVAAPRRRKRWVLPVIVAGGLAAVVVVVVIALGRGGTPVCSDSVRTGCAALCKADDPEACYLLARTLHKADPVDHEAARVADMRACALGKDEACVAASVALIGVVERDSRPNDPRKLDRLREIAALLNTACERNFLEACRRLAREVSVGYGHLPPDPPHAFALISKACAGDDVAACKILVDMIGDPDNGGTPELREAAHRTIADACKRKPAELSAGLVTCDEPASNGPGSAVATGFHCFAWVHGPEFSTDCYRTVKACSDARAAMKAGARDTADRCATGVPHAACTAIRRDTEPFDERCFGELASCERYRAFVTRNGLTARSCAQQ